MEKITNVKALAYVLENVNLPKEYAEKIEKMKAQFEKKNSAEKKPTATQKANEDLKEKILEGMVEGKAYSITDLIKSIEVLNDLTNQKVSALIGQMVKSGSVIRTEEKRKAYFSKA